MRKQHYIFIVLILLILSVAFYWYELRPNQIRKECIQLVNNQGFDAQKFANEKIGKTYFDEIAYQKCLRENGIEK